MTGAVFCLSEVTVAVVCAAVCAAVVCAAEVGAAEVCIKLVDAALFLVVLVVDVVGAAMFIA